MAFIEQPRFPEQIAHGATGGPGFLTTVVASQSGWENRNGLWAYARAQYEVGLVNRTAAETQTLLAFFYSVARGRLNAFRYKDYGAGESTGTDEPLGTGTGASATYQLIKRYALGGLVYDRIITKPVAGTVTIQVGGVPTGAFAVDTTTGLVTITAASGAAITASFQFDVPVRFNTDVVRMQRNEGLFSWPSIELVEVRDIV